MKVQIDTQNKTIKVEDKVSLKEFEKQFKKIKDGLKAMGEDWEKYSLETNTVIHHWDTYPVYIEKPLTTYVPYRPYRPWWEPPFTTYVPYRPWWEPPYVVSCGTAKLNTISNTTTDFAVATDPSLYTSATTFNLELN